MFFMFFWVSQVEFGELNLNTQGFSLSGWTFHGWSLCFGRNPKPDWSNVGLVSVLISIYVREEKSSLANFRSLKCGGKHAAAHIRALHCFVVTSISSELFLPTYSALLNWSRTLSFALRFLRNTLARLRNYALVLSAHLFNFVSSSFTLNIEATSSLIMLAADFLYQLTKLFHQYWPTRIYRLSYRKRERDYAFWLFHQVPNSFIQLNTICVGVMNFGMTSEKVCIGNASEA